MTRLEKSLEMNVGEERLNMSNVDSFDVKDKMGENSLRY